MRSIITIICGGAILILAACQKKGNIAADPAKVNIQINSPAQGQTFRSNDTVNINSSISYPSELHGYEVMITDTSTGFIVYDDAQHTHTDHFTIGDKWSTAVSKPTALKLTIIANIDHTGNNATKELFFEIIP